MDDRATDDRATDDRARADVPARAGAPRGGGAFVGGTGGVGVMVAHRVEWRDTDASGHYHHSAVMRWVESAETVLHERLGVGDLMAHLPRVHYEVDYHDRLYYRDDVEVSLVVAAVGETSLRYRFEVRRASDAAPAARGTIVVVNADPTRPGAGGKLPWPDRVRAALLGAGPVGR